MMEGWVEWRRGLSIMEVRTMRRLSSTVLGPRQKIIAPSCLAFGSSAFVALKMNQIPAQYGTIIFCRGPYGEASDLKTRRLRR